MTRASWIRALPFEELRGVLASTTSREQPATRRISPSAFANPCRHHRPLISPFRGVDSSELNAARPAAYEARDPSIA